MDILNKILQWWLIPKPRAFLWSRSIVEDLENDFITYKQWKKDAKAAHPIRYFLQETIPHFYRSRIKMNISHAWYWLRTHTYNRYHILSLASPQNHYEWGWIERDQAILHACFNLLKDYVEEEMGQVCYYAPANEEYGSPEWDHREEEDEINALYQWWMVDRDKHIDENKNYFYEDACEDDEMLLRLMKIRRHLWS